MKDVWAFMGSSGRGNDDFELLEEVQLVEGVIGSAESCALRLADPLITPRHAQLQRVGGEWHLSQVAIASPTRINGRVIELGTTERLASGDLVEMGTAHFRVGGEPPARRGVDPRDQAARVIWADQLAERGDPLGEALLQGRQPELALFGLNEDHTDEFAVERVGGLIVGIELQHGDCDLLHSLCAGAAGETIERITLPIASAVGSEHEHLRGILQTLAATKPPRLRRLALGWIHEVTDLAGASRDWKAIARRIPLEGSLHDAVRRAGRPRATILRASPGWPPVGACLELAEVGGPEEGPGWVPYDPQRPLMEQYEDSTLVHLFAPPGRAAMIIGQYTSINGRIARHGVLTHGDLVEGPHFAFRFEED